MAKYAPVVLRNNSEDTYVSRRNYRPVDISAEARTLTLWKDETTGLLAVDVEKFESVMDSLQKG